MNRKKSDPFGKHPNPAELRCLIGGHQALECGYFKFRCAAIVNYTSDVEDITKM
jgi:hypothetical protein